MEQMKLKTLAIMDILKETDETHPMTANDICAELAGRGITAERKSVSRDIKLLIESGMDIVMCRDKKQGCFLASRQFEDWELKILIDAVWQAKFLSKGASKNLTDKLLETTGRESKETLRSVTPVESHAKTKNKSTQIAIDAFLRAIGEGLKVSFQYISYDSDMKQVLRKSGRIYTVSPYSMIWSSDFYYLICNSDGHEGLSYYRLDRMKNIKITVHPAQPIRDVTGANPKQVIEEFVKNSIHHYGGQKTFLTLRVAASMMDYLADQFGTDIIIKDDGEMFLATVETSVSDGLYYWLFQFGENIKIVSPDNIRKEYVRRLKDIVKKY